MPRYKLTIEYDGSEFNGFQAQKNCLTIQSVLEESIFKLTQEKVRIFASGRTDTGVHSLGQVVHFDITNHIALHTIQDAINFHLKPYLISVVDAEEKDEHFHARFSAHSRYYRYIILNRRAPSVLLKNRAWHVRHILNISNMNIAAQYLIGKHDFTSFRALHCQAHSPFKTINEIKIRQENELIYIDIKAHSFLYHMVRNIVGSLKLVGQGEWAPEELQTILQAKNRRLAAPTAPAWGLYFMASYY